MQQVKLQIPYFVSKFKAHDTIKGELISLLDEQMSSTTNDGYAKITKSDWYVDPGTPRNYWTLLYPHLETHIKELMDSIGTSHYKFLNYWFAHYETSDYLDWHRHEQIGWSSIYYVNLPSKEQVTLLKDPMSGDVIQPDLEEGDILTFPGIVYHRSPVNNAQKPKTIVAFNIS
jgi:hypothetical protein